MSSEIPDDKEGTAPIRELLREAKILAARYYTLTGKPLGVTGEVAELEAAEQLNLALAPARQPDYDAFRTSHRTIERYQVKGRAVDPIDRYRGRVPSIEYDRNFEWVLLVLLDRSTYSTLEIWQASREDVRNRLEAPGSKARNERNSMAITQFKSIARRIWPEQKPLQTPAGVHIREGVRGEKVTREDAIYHASHHCKSSTIQGDNTRFSNINARKDVWWIDIPAEMITGPTLNLLNLLLCDTRPSRPHLHHLQIPISYLRRNLENFRIRDDKNAIHLELSSVAENLFQDVIGPGRVKLGQFRHCGFDVSGQT